MTFLHPILLGAGVACVAIPIAIHLLMRRRRKPVRWAAMRFLLEAYKQRQRRVRLEQLLLLISRCLLIALIATAVARPLIGHDPASPAGPREVYILIDNSLTSATTDASGATDLALSIERARALLAELEPARGDRAALITLAAPAQAVVSPATSDLGAIDRRLETLLARDSRMDLAGAAALIPPTGAGTGPRGLSVAVLSAFREGSLGRAEPVGPLPADTALSAAPPAAEARPNTAISAFDLARPVVAASGDDMSTGASQARVGLLRAASDADRQSMTTVRVSTEQTGAIRELGSAVVRWAPGQREAHTTIDIDLTGMGAAGRTILRAEIDRDSNERDNIARTLLDVRDHLRVAIVGTRRFGARPRLESFGPSDWLGLALEPTEEGAARLEVSTLDAARLDPGALAGLDAVLVAEPGRISADGWAALGACRARGVAIVLTPAASPGAQVWPEQARPALGLDWDFAREPAEVPPTERGLVASTAAEDDLLWMLRSELDALAETVSAEQLLGVSPGDDAEVLLTTEGGAPFLLVTTTTARAPTAGPVVMLTTALDLSWTDLPARPLMVPLVQELVRSAIGRGRSPRAATAGARFAAPVGAVELVSQTGADARPLPVDPSDGLTRDPVRDAGAYLARDAGGVEIGAVIARPDTGASDTTPVPPDRVEAWLGAGSRFAWAEGVTPGADASPTDGARESGAPGPGLALLLAALLIACVELGLARLVSHASRPGGAE